MKNFFQRPFSALSQNLGLWKDVVHHGALIEMARQRVFVAGCFVAFAYLLIAGRLIDVMVLRTSTHTRAVNTEIPFAARKDIVDRNGEVLATQLITASLYANPKVILNPKEAAEKLAAVFPEIGKETFYNRLANNQKGFVWLVRHIPPKLQNAVHNLGIPGIFLQKDSKRIYPHGPLVAHVLGCCGVDGDGLSGIENSFNTQLLDVRNNPNEPLRLSIDLRAQHIVFDALMLGVQKFKADGGNAMVMDLKTGEIISMVSFPTFNPNLLNHNDPKASFNRNTSAVNEPGSTFKILNVAIALESGTANLNSTYDARTPVKIGRFTVDDFKGKYRILSLSEAFIYSSNIAAIKMALNFGIETQRQYFKKMGLFDPIKLEIPENGAPLIPARWSQVTTMTASYGYGVSVTPLQTLAAIGMVINDGVMMKPTLLHQNTPQVSSQTPIISYKTSAIVRSLMRRVIKEGTAKSANIPGYGVIGKTGTAYQSKGKGYGVNKSRTTTFIGAFGGSGSDDAPENLKYGLIVMLDNPKAIDGTYGYATAGWNAAPIAGEMIKRMAPVLGVTPSFSEDENLSPWVQTSARIPQ